MVKFIYQHQIIYLWPLLEFFLNIISPVNYKHEHINKFNKKKLKKLWLKVAFKL